MKLVSVILILLSTTPSQAVFDCGFMLEKREELGELNEILDQVQTYSEQGWIGKWLEKKENNERLVQVDTRLKKLGIGFTRNKLAYTFTDEGEHQINRVSKYLKKFGITFTWEARMRGSKASLETHEDPYKHEGLNRLFKQKSKDISVSTETLKTILTLNKQTDGTVRHELLHVKTILNLTQKKEGYFYGAIYGSSVFGYEGLFSTDEIPASIEGLMGEYDYTKNFPKLEELQRDFKSEIKNSSIDTIYSYAKLNEEAQYMAELYKELIHQLEQYSWNIPELKADYYGTYIDSLTLERTLEKVTIVLSPNKTKFDILWVKKELKNRLEFHQALFNEIKTLKSQYADKIYFRDPMKSMNISFRDDKWYELLNEIHEKMPTLRRMVEPMWAFKN